MEVTLYEKDDKTGKTFSTKIDVPKIFNKGDGITIVNVPDGYFVILFENKNYNKNENDKRYVRIDSGETNLEDYGFNDKADSLKICKVGTECP